jgi:hypothetical protein
MNMYYPNLRSYNGAMQTQRVRTYQIVPTAEFFAEIYTVTYEDAGRVPEADLGRLVPVGAWRNWILMRLVAALIVVVSLGASSECLAKPKETKKTKETTAETPFGKAQAAFSKEIASIYQRNEAGLRITPAREDLTGYPEQKTGDLLAFQAEWPITPSPAAGPKTMAVRGFASPSGEVVLAKKNNLSVLLRAAHFLDEKQSLPAKAIAERLLWMGSGPPGSPNHQLLETGGVLFMPPPLGSVQIEPPRIERRTDASARLIFFYSTSDAAGVVTQRRAELRCARDYTIDPFAL